MDNIIVIVKKNKVKDINSSHNNNDIIIEFRRKKFC